MYPIIEEEEPIQETNQCITESDKLIEETENIKVAPLQTLDITNLQDTLNEIYQLCKEVQNKINLMESNATSDDESNYESCEENLDEYNPDDIMVIHDEIEIKDANLAIKVYNDDDKGKMPERAHENDAGFDVRYTGEESLTIKSQQTSLIDLFIAMEIPAGIICQLMSRSSLALKGIDVKGGTIDSGYTGNISVILYNRSIEDYTIQPNDKIAQAVFLQLAPIERLQPVETRQDLEESNRGTSGFGSTNSEDMIAYFLNQEKEDDKPIEQRELTQDQDQALNQLLEEYDDIFAAELHELGRINEVQHLIDTGDERPIRQRAY